MSISNSDIDIRICDFCKKFTIHVEGQCIEHWNMYYTAEQLEDIGEPT